MGIEAEHHDIQGNILRPYGAGFPCARYQIVRILDGGGARRLLGRLLDRKMVTTAEAWAPEAKPAATFNVFFSFRGLAAMGVPTAALESFPAEFREGMAARWKALGDPDPATWEFGADPEQLHVFFAAYGRSGSDRKERLQELREELESAGGAVEIVHRQDAALFENRREHFGFADGIGQPDIEGSGAPQYRGDGTALAGGGWEPVKTGEFVLGWPNESRHFLGEMPVPAALGRNGSYLVYRKLEQDVPAFRRFLREQAPRLFGSDAPENVERLAAKLVGRWRSGCPIALSPDADNEELGKNWGFNNDFRYAADPKGAVCPVGAHIRRMNPRDGLPFDSAPLARAHRIIRRGLPYGPQLAENAEDNEKRGVAFMAIGASLSHQFETLQRDWANSGEFARLDASEVDPLLGEPRDRSLFRMPLAAGGSQKIFDLPRFVTLRGGGYFFIPSLTALRYLAALQP